MELATLLISEGANVNKSNIENVTSLHCAVSLGDLDFVTFLVKEKRVSVNCRDIHLNTPLLLAAQTSNTEILSFLIKNGAMVNTTDECKRSRDFYF